MAGERDLEAAAQGGAGQGCRERGAAGFKAAKQARQAGHGVHQFGRCHLVAGFGAAPGMALRRGFHQGKVRPGAERGFAGSEDDTADRIVG